MRHTVADVSGPVLAVLAVVAVAAVAGPVPPADAGWQPPVPGPVVGRFAVGPDPFAAGQRRGIDFAAAAGTAVTAPCGGSVAFAGAVPRRGGAVSLRCGRLTATVLGLVALAVRRGAVVRPGDRLGTVGSAGRVRLGARRTQDGFGYRDPEPLLERGTAMPPVGTVPRRGPGRGPRGPHVGGRHSIPVPRATGHVWEREGDAVADARRTPLAAWLGLALVAGALPAGGLVARPVRARRYRRTATAAG
jgi:hypothetical protein